MRLTAILRAKERAIKSLAISVHFKQPALGMNDYEILSRATAFLLSVDAKDPAVPPGPYGHLEAAERKREEREYKNFFNRSLPTGPGRKMMDMGWMEFVPREYRPNVHVVCSSHVVSPYLWKDYYPQDWLSQVRPEHCKYTLEVFDPEDPPSTEPKAKFDLNSQPFHHPEGKDLALLHFREELDALKILKSLGVEVLYLRDNEKRFEKGEEVVFDGFVVTERNPADNETFLDDADDTATTTSEPLPQQGDSEKGNNNNENENAANDEDVRIFHPCREIGKLAFHTEDRFFATTEEPLSEGMCGCPVLDKDGDCCGTVEGIVPLSNPNKDLAGAAAFQPSYMMKVFIDYVERNLVEKMMPKDLFDMVVAAKKTNSIGGGLFKKDPETGTMTAETTYSEEYDKALQEMRAKYTPREYEAIMNTVRRERDEVLRILDEEGDHDMNEVIQRVRNQTMEMKALILDQYRKGQLGDVKFDPEQGSAGILPDDVVAERYQKGLEEVEKAK